MLEVTRKCGGGGAGQWWGDGELDSGKRPCFQQPPPTGQRQSSRLP